MIVAALRLRPDPRQRVVAAVLGAALVGTSAGWAGASSWYASQNRDASLNSYAASAVVTRVTRTNDGPQRTSAELSVQVDNLGGISLRVSSAQPGYQAGTITDLTPQPLRVPPRSSHALAVGVAVDCSSPQQLGLPPLTFTSPDGVDHTVDVDGATQALADLCNGTPGGPAVLEVLGVRHDEQRLRISITSPTGRATDVRAVYAGGVQLHADPFPVTIAGMSSALWLRPPDRCPSEWANGGFPRTLDLDIVSGSTATIEITVGYPLARWLLDRACGQATS